MRISKLARTCLIALCMQAAFYSPAIAAHVLIISATGESSVTALTTKRLCEFYGLQYKLLAPEAALSRLVRNNSADDPILAAVIDTPSIEMMHFDELETLRRVIELGGIQLLVHSRKPNARALDGLEQLTGVPEIRFAELDGDASYFRISRLHPEVTKEFTGITKRLAAGIKRRVLIIKASDRDEELVTLIAVSSTDQQAYQPIFAELRRGKGTIFIAASGSMQKLNGQLISMYNWENLPVLVPIMMFLRLSCGEYCWHREVDYANLTIDDANLVEPYGSLNYTDLLEHMKEHNFHTTVAFIPYNYDRTQHSSFNIFLENPRYYSLAMHGNNHDHREFGPYHERPLDEQRMDIIQGIARMERLRQLTSLPYDKVMIFPHDISPANTLGVLKRYNFLCTVNRGNVPLGSEPSPWFDFNMRPVNMDYETFPSLDRRFVESDLYVFDLFIDKPAILFGHLYGTNNLFKDGIAAFDATANRINRLRTQVEWRSLGYIAKNLYLERVNSDGTVSVKMFSSQLNLKNKSKVARTFHIKKRESSNISISEVLVDGKAAEYSIENGHLNMTITLQALQTIKINVKYDGVLPADITLQKNDPKVWLLRHGSEFRDRFLSTKSFGIPLVLLWEKMGFQAFIFFVAACVAFFLVFILASVFLFVRRRRRTLIITTKGNF